MSAAGTAAAKKSTTVEVPNGSDGRSPVSQIAAAREAKLAKARAAVALDDAAVAAANSITASLPLKKAKRIPAALNLVQPKATKVAKATKPAAIAAGSKACGHCKVVKLLNSDNYAKDASNKATGFYGTCKVCETAMREAKRAALAAATVVVPVKVKKSKAVATA